MTIRDISIAFGYDIDQRSVSAAESSIKGLKSMATKLLGIVGIGFTVAGISNLSQAAADAEALKSQFTQVFGVVEEEATSSLEKIANDTGVVVNRMKGSFTQIAAFAKTTGMEEAEALEIADRALVAVADSAAFYDRSIETVTASLQSFLKGNYANDAALGLSCTQVTRDAAANEMYGKSFTDLSEAQKQLTLLKMVEDANELSGALGQAARESDTWTNQLGNLKQNVTDLKAAVGNAFLSTAVSVLKILSSLVGKVTDVVKDLTSETGIVTKAFDRMNALVKRLQPAMERFANSMKVGIGKAKTVVLQIIDKFGGMNNFLKILAITASAVLLVMKWGKIVAGAQMFIKALNTIKMMFTGAKIQALAMVAVIVLIALVVEDFINFLLGNDSVIGTAFDKAGIGADNARQAIFEAFDKVKEFLAETWETIKSGAGMALDKVKEFWENNGEEIKANVERVWGIISQALSGVWTFISQLASAIFGDIEEETSGSTEGTSNKVLSVWQRTLNALSAVFNALFRVGSRIFNALATVIEVVFSAIQSFWSAWGPTVISFFKGLCDSLGTIVNGFLEVIEGIANFISAVFSGDWAAAWEAIKQIFSGVWEVMKGIASSLWNAVSTTLAIGLGILKGIWDSTWGAISSFFQGIWNGILSFIQGIWATITGVISVAIQGAYNTVSTILSSIYNSFMSIFNSVKTFVSETFGNILSSIKDTVGNIKDAIVDGLTKAIDWIKELPSQALEWGSDIIGGIVDGITGAVGKVTDAVSGVADKIKSFLHFSVPDEGPLTTYESWMPDFMEGLAKGINSNKSKVLDSVKQVANGINDMMNGITAEDVEFNAVGSVGLESLGNIVSSLKSLSKASAVSSKTVSTSKVSNRTSSLTQNVNINNSYSGGTTEAQKKVSKAMEKSAVDSTTLMARGLAYARG